MKICLFEVVILISRQCSPFLELLIDLFKELQQCTKVYFLYVVFIRRRNRVHHNHGT